MESMEGKSTNVKVKNCFSIEHLLAKPDKIIPPSNSDCDVVNNNIIKNTDLEPNRELLTTPDSSCIEENMDNCSEDMSEDGLGKEYKDF